MTPNAWSDLKIIAKFPPPPRSSSPSFPCWTIHQLLHTHCLILSSPGYPCHKCNTTLSSLIQFYNHFLKSCPAAPMIAIDAYTDDTTSGKAPAANAIVVSSGGWVGIGSKTRSSSSSTSSSSCNGRRRRGTRSRSCSVFSSSFYGGGRGQDRIISSSSSSRKRQETTL